MSVANLMECDAYWCPITRRIKFRAVTARKRFSLPADAVLIGRYAHPFAARSFLKRTSMMSSRASKSASLPDCPFSVGDSVKTPTGELAFVVDVDNLRGEATVHWPRREGVEASACFRWKVLRRASA